VLQDQRLSTVHTLAQFMRIHVKNIRRQLFVLFNIWRIIQVRKFFFVLIIIFNSTLGATLIGQIVLNVCFEKSRNNTLSLTLLLKLSINPWLP